MGLEGIRILKRGLIQRLTAPNLGKRLTYRALYALTSPTVLRVVGQPLSWLGAAGGMLRRAPAATDLKIAFDYQIFAMQRVGGVSRYYTALAQELFRMGKEIRIVAPLHRGQYLDDLAAGVVVGGKQNRLPLDVDVVNSAVNVLASRVILGAYRPDVVHETYYSPLGSAPRRTPTVLTVFDMIHELYPEDFRHPAATSMVKRAAVNRADHVICISHQTRNDLIRLFDCPPEKVSVVHLAAEVPSAAPVSRQPLPVGDAPFILHVGNREGYKNFRGLLLAIAASPSLRREFRVVAFGSIPFTPGETKAIDEAGLTGRVVHIGGDDAVLDELYRRAAALVYPSKYEGFGLPPLEAMARGCPVVCSNSSSLPEVVGDAAELFDPGDVSAMTRAMEAVLFSEARKSELIRRGAERVRQFSWRRCAEETLAVYRSLVA